AVAVGVDIDDELQAGLGEPREAEVGDLDGLTLLGRQDDAHLGELVDRVQLGIPALALVDHLRNISAHPRSTGSAMDGFVGRIVSVVTAADPVTFVIAVALAAAISAGGFAHASRHGSQHETAWVIAAFLAAVIAVPVYFIRHWTRRGGRK